MKYIIFVLLLAVSASLQAAPSCSKNGTRVIYTNGVTTKRDKAQDALEKMIALNLNSQIDLKSTSVRYRLAYNYEESISRDFLEAAVQRFPVGFLQSLGVTNGYAAYMGYLSGGLSDAIYAVALNSIVDKIVEIQSDWLINYRSGSLYLQTIREIKGHYETSLNNGERVFAISHSQGGLFMSDAFDQTSFTDKQKYFSGFQIASPLNSEMNSYFGYATHDKDRLINFVRSTVGALPANVSAPLIVNNSYEGISDYAIDFVINHGIVTTYLNDSTIKSQVIPRLIATAQLLESNCPKAVINYSKNSLSVKFYSTDPENPNVTGLTYTWNFGDSLTANTTSKTFSHSYVQGGTYNVSLTVTDSFGASDTTSTQVSVEANFIKVKIDPRQTFFQMVSNPYNDIYRPAPAIPIPVNTNGIGMLEMGAFTTWDGCIGQPGCDQKTMVVIFSDGVNYLNPGANTVNINYYQFSVPSQYYVPPQAFAISTDPNNLSRVEIPVGAKYIFVSPADAYFRDNNDYNNDYYLYMNSGGF